MSLQSAPLPITIDHPEEVDALLCARPDLRAYMEEAARRLIDKFGPGSAVLLDVTKDDPEDRMLVVKVKTALPGATALALLDEFDYEWWLAQPPAIQTQIITNFILV
jgi:hypothetical protein